jgi:hypothetical protein
MSLRSILGSTQACIAIGFAIGAAALLGTASPARAGLFAPPVAQTAAR